MLSRLMAVLLLAAVPLIPADPEKPTVDITLERWTGSEWQAVEAKTVFEANDQVRFRFQSSVPGYLYVLNRGSRGETEWLFPNRQTGLENQVEPGRSYLVPATEGAFVISGDPGFDITYWLINPTPLADWASLGSLPPVRMEDTLLPRCRESLLRARGTCVDDRAGPGPVTKPSQVAPVFGEQNALQSRSLRFTGKGSGTRITAPAQTPLMYEFRIAHR